MFNDQSPSLALVMIVFHHNSLLISSRKKEETYRKLGYTWPALTTDKTNFTLKPTGLTTMTRSHNMCTSEQDCKAEGYISDRELLYHSIFNNLVPMSKCPLMM